MKVSNEELIAKNIMLAFRENSVFLGDACVYSSYLTKQLLQEKLNLKAKLVAGTVNFSPADIGLAYMWDPPREFHMWTKLGLKIIDIAVIDVPMRDDFNPKYLNSHYIKDKMFPLVWDKNPPFKYTKVKNGVKQIESPVDSEIYKKLYKHTSDLIDEELKNNIC
ncbi:MAG: hypothetical protein L0L22_10905 [Staphylococcus equorum]|nr:hypothetical protein [Tetragenococcus koreensis]MDN6571496.1 hypothetical protein [Staphylococcus equorum]